MKNWITEHESSLFTNSSCTANISIHQGRSYGVARVTPATPETWLATPVDKPLWGINGIWINISNGLNIFFSKTLKSLSHYNFLDNVPYANF